MVVFDCSRENYAKLKEEVEFAQDQLKFKKATSLIIQNKNEVQTKTKPISKKLNIKLDV